MVSQCCLWKVILHAFVAITVTGNVACDDYSQLTKMINYVLVVDQSPPVIANWTPSPKLFNTSFQPNKIYTWANLLVSTLLKEAVHKRIDARVAVFLLDRNNDQVSMQGEFTIKGNEDYSIFNVYKISGLSNVSVQPYQLDQNDFERIKKKVSTAIAATRPSYWRGATEIVIWHVPYDGKDPSRIDQWRRMHSPVADVMVALEDYGYSGVDIFGVMSTVIISHPLVKEAYSMNFRFHTWQRDFQHDNWTKELWDMLNSCRAEIKSPCYFDDSDACVIVKSYVHRSVEAALLKYCKNWPVYTVICPRGETCNSLCNDAPAEDSQCSATCGEGKKVRRARKSTDALTQHCEPLTLSCDLPACESREPWLKPWKIYVLISVLCVVFMAVCICLCLWCGNRSYSKARKQALAAGHRPDYSDTPENVRSTGRAAVGQWSRRAQARASGQPREQARAGGPPS